MYNTIVRTHFDYCSSLHLRANKEQINDMQKIQNRAMRIILKCDYRTPREVMFNTLNMLSIEQKIKMNVLNLIFKTKMKMVPDYIHEQITYNRDNHGINTRNKYDFKIPTYKSNNSRNSIFYRGLQMFNELPNQTKESKTMNRFKGECIKYVKHRNLSQLKW